jgi:hypothetical protein
VEFVLADTYAFSCDQTYEVFRMETPLVRQAEPLCSGTIPCLELLIKSSLFDLRKRKTATYDMAVSCVVYSFCSQNEDLFFDGESCFIVHAGAPCMETQTRL